MNVERERARFRIQVAAQRGNEFQWVQTSSGGLIHREQFELGRALIATIGFVGDAERFGGPACRYAYLESRSFLDHLTWLDARLRRCEAPLVVDFDPPTGPESRRPFTLLDTNVPEAFLGLRLATDGMAYPRALYGDTTWAQSDVRHAMSYQGTRAVFPGEASRFEASRRWDDGGCFCERDRFRRAFPVRSSLYSNPDFRNQPAYQGFNGLW